jgi:formate dehydrogenase iron-sulfur subunit
MAGPNSLYGPVDPAPDAGYVDAPPRVGFFTDTSVCIGCKACEVACKEWNALPADGPDHDQPDLLALTADSYDNTGALGASTYRHVAFVEQTRPRAAAATVDLGMPLPAGDATEVRWLMASDVCKHCTHAACLDVCPTGALIRTEHGTVLVQDDVCNGCGYCIPACPYGVIDQRKGSREEGGGGAFKCTMCHDRLGAGLQPACATACPTESIQFGPLDELRERAKKREADLHAQGLLQANLYGHDEKVYGGLNAFFLLMDEPETYKLPNAKNAVLPQRNNKGGYLGLLGTAVLGLFGAVIALRERGMHRREAPEGPPEGGEA